MRVYPAIFVVFLAVLCPAAWAGGACKPARYTVMGQVTDSAGDTGKGEQQGVELARGRVEEDGRAGAALPPLPVDRRRDAAR